MKLFVLSLALFFIQPGPNAKANISFTKNLLGESQTIIQQQTMQQTMQQQKLQCRPLNNGRVDWPIRNPSIDNKSNIDCVKMFNRLSGQTLYFYDDHDEDDPQGSILLKSNFFKYPEPVDCLDNSGNIIDCPNLDIEKIIFTKKTKNAKNIKSEKNILMATILHPDTTFEKVIVKLINNEKICQISIAKSYNLNNHNFNNNLNNHNVEIYNILALYDGRLDKNNNPICNEETIALAPTFQDIEAKNICKAKVENEYQEALKKIDPRDHKELKRRSNKLKQNCDKAVLNQMRINFYLSPGLNF